MPKVFSMPPVEPPLQQKFATARPAFAQTRETPTTEIHYIFKKHHSASIDI
jgi:hypothetical protein